MALFGSDEKKVIEGLGEAPTLSKAIILAFENAFTALDAELDQYPEFAAGSLHEPTILDEINNGFRIENPRVVSIAHQPEDLDGDGRREKVVSVTARMTLVYGTDNS